MSCTACPGDACPMSCNGCHQARKLIGHYRECRKKQRSHRYKGQKSHCLLCTLVGRHKPDKILQDKICITATQPTKSIVRAKECIDSNATMHNDIESMPPPPPRPRIASVGSIHNVNRISLRTLSLSENLNNRQDGSVSSLLCRARSVSLDDRKAAKSSKFEIDPTAESHLADPSRQSLEIQSCELTAITPKLRNQGRRRSMSCNNMLLDNRCETILEETQLNGNNMK